MCDPKTFSLENCTITSSTSSTTGPGRDWLHGQLCSLRLIGDLRQDLKSTQEHQVLTKLNVAWFQWSCDNWHFHIDNVMCPLKILNTITYNPRAIKKISWDQCVHACMHGFLFSNEIIPLNADIVEVIKEIRPLNENAAFMKLLQLDMTHWHDFVIGCTLGCRQNKYLP